MPILFPPEIIEFSAENYYARLRTRSKLIYLSIVSAVAITIGLLPIIKIDVSTQSRGILRSSIENTVIQSSVYGEVIDYLLYENKNVVAGDTLIVFNTGRIDEQILLEFGKKGLNNLFISDIDRLLNKKGRPESSQYIAEYNRYSSKIKELEIQINFLKKDYETNLQLLNKKVISEYEFLTQKNELEKIQSLLSNLHEEFHTTWQSEKTKLEIENQTLTSNIKQLEKEKRNCIITAPISGTLVQVAGFQVGNFIGPNQVIAYISSSDSLLSERLSIPYLAYSHRFIFKNLQIRYFRREIPIY